MPTTKNAAGQIERRRAVYETAKKALIAACAAHLRSIADDSELCAAIAHYRRIPISQLVDQLRKVSVGNTVVHDYVNSLGECPIYGASLAIHVTEKKRLRSRYVRFDIPLEVVKDSGKYASWRAEKIGRTLADRVAKARELCRERREVNSAIEALPPELQRIALGKRG